MSKIDKLIKELCPNGVEYKTIGEIFNVRNGYTPSKKNEEYWTNGDIPWFRMEDIRLHGNILDDAVQHITKEAVKNKLFPRNSLMVATTATIGVHALITTDFICNQQLTCVSVKDEFKDDIDIKFYHYYFDIVDQECVKLASNSGGMPILSLEKMKNIKVPVPPLEVQCEIAHILDTFTLHTADLTAELTARKQQYEYYKNKLLKNYDEVENCILCNVAEYSKERISAEHLNEYNYVGVDNLLQNKLGKTTSSHAPKTGNSTKYVENDILIGNIRPYLKKIWFADQIGGTNGDVLAIHITNENVFPKYLYYILSSDKFFDYDTNNSKGAKMPRGNKESIMQYRFYLPSLEEQKKIADILDRFEKYTTDITSGLPAEIEGRQKQYEYYRDTLLNFKELDKK